MRILVVTMCAVLVAGCGGTEDGQGGGPPGWTPNAAGPPAEVAAAQAASPALDLGEPSLMPGHVRLEGGCGGGFPYHMQHPQGWNVTASHLGFNKDRSDGASFSIRVGDDFGVAHAVAQAAVQKEAGARNVGTVDIGGQAVEVLARDDHAYLLFAPHPWGPSAVGYYWLIVNSTLGDTATLEILGTLVPVGGC